MVARESQRSQGAALRTYSIFFPKRLLRTHALLRKGNPPVLNVIPGGPLFVYLAEEIDDRVGSGDEDRSLLLETAKGISEVKKRDMATEDWAQ